MIQEVFGYLKSKKVEQFLRINDSPKYLKRLCEKFESKKNSIEKYNCYQLKQEAKFSEFVAEEAILKDKLKLIIQKTKELQKHVGLNCFLFQFNGFKKIRIKILFP